MNAMKTMQRVAAALAAVSVAATLFFGGVIMRGLADEKRERAGLIGTPVCGLLVKSNHAWLVLGDGKCAPMELTENFRMVVLSKPDCAPGENGHWIVTPQNLKP